MQRTLTGCGSTLSKLTLVIALGVAIGLSTQRVNAVDVFTDPVGFVTMAVLGTNNVPNAVPYETHNALGMTQLPVSRGNATAAGANQVGISDASVTAGQFNRLIDNGGVHTNPAYFVELTSGSMAGTMDDIVSNSATAVFTADDLSSAIGGGCTYKIYPHWTLQSVFGPANQAGLKGGTSSTADLINIWNVNQPQGYGPVFYFKTSGGGGTGWRAFSTGTSINCSNDVLYLDQGITITHTGTNVNILVVGGVKLGQTLAVVTTNGDTQVANPYPAGIILSQTGLYTTNNATGLKGGTSSTADLVQIWNPTNPSGQGYAPVYYFKTSGGGGTGWRSFSTGTSVDVSTNVIPLGAVMTITRQAGNPSFNWFAPQPFTP